MSGINWVARPRYRWLSSGRLQLTDRAILATPWGTLTLEMGYTWDGVSGFRRGGFGRRWVEASAAHDAMYVLHCVPRANADLVFRTLADSRLAFGVLRVAGGRSWETVPPWFEQSVGVYARWTASPSGGTTAIDAE